jgi:predicted secreted protein
MGLVSGVVVYQVIWWMVLFMVLPHGNRPPEEVEEGHATSAPERPRVWMKIGITTAIATVLFIVYFFVERSGLVSVT